MQGHIGGKYFPLKFSSYMTKYSTLRRKFHSKGKIPLNPKPHGQGRICPHIFQGLISQKVLKCKKSAQNTIPRKTSAESKSRVKYPSKNVNLCLFSASEQAEVIKKATLNICHLSQPPHFHPHPGGGGWVAVGG